MYCDTIGLSLHLLYLSASFLCSMTSTYMCNMHSNILSHNLYSLFTIRWRVIFIRMAKYLGFIDIIFKDCYFKLQIISTYY